MKNIVSLILFLIILTSCRQHKNALSKLDYASEEIFPIQIDKYGIPNVKIEFRKNPIWIQWDTGDMVGLVLSKSIIPGYNLTIKDSIQLRDSAGKSVGFSYRYLADSINIFGKIYSNLLVSESQGDYMGLIGPRFIDLNRFTLDYKNRLIAISNTSLAQEKIKGEKLLLVPSERLPRLIVVEGYINGNRVLVELDTGKSRTVIDSDAAREWNLKEGEKGTIIDNLSLGGIDLQIDNAKLKSFKGISKSFPDPIIVGIGSDILSDFIFTVDYEQGIAVLSPRE